jgi:tRNA A-37 threonylcarbamoyl transferase component Bud32
MIRYEYPSIGISSNAKIFMGTLEKKQNEIIDIAVKLQQNNPNAENEAMISMELSGLYGIPKYFTYGLYGPQPKLNYIIMERLGPTFGSSEKITVGSTFEINKLRMLFNNYSIQLINGIETLYRHNYYHVDITTSNILFGIGDYQDFLYLIDFCNIAETKVEYESDIHNFNKNCNNSLYNAISDIIIKYALNQYAIFFKYSISVITSTIEFIIKSIILTDTIEPPKFQALRDMLSNLAKDIILPLQADNNIFRFAIENGVVKDEIVPFLLEEAKK